MSDNLRYIKKPKGKESKTARKKRLENNRLYKQAREKAKEGVKPDEQTQPPIDDSQNQDFDQNIDDQSFDLEDDDEPLSSPEPTKKPLQDIGYSPFNEPVTKREYTTPNIDPSELRGELQEPIFTAPSLEELEAMDTDGGKETDSEPASPKRSEPTQINPAFSELPKKEKQMGAEMMADVVIDGYSKLGTGIGSLAKISESKLDREFADGNIDANILLPINEFGDTVTVKEFVQEFNSEAKEAFETSQEFKDKVRPPLIRVFEKRGIGMTDEQLLFYYFGTDIASKGFTAVQLRKSSNAILDNLREQTQMMRDRNAPPPPKSSQTDNAPAQQFETSRETQQEYQEPEEMNTNSAEEEAIIVDETSGFAETKYPENMPEFGNKELLADMQKLAEREEAKQKTKENKQK